MVDMGLTPSSAKMKEKELSLAEKEALLADKEDDIAKKKEQLDNIVKEEGEKLKEIAKMVGMGMQRQKEIKTVIMDGEISIKKNVVDIFKELPSPSENRDKLYFVKGKTFRHKRGFYYSDGKKWKKI